MAVGAVAGAFTGPAAQADVPALTTADVNPVYLSANDEAQSGLTPPASLLPGSFAFYFDTTEDKTVNALGFFTVSDWITSSGPDSFDVVLYKWMFDGMVDTTFTPLAMTTFVRSDANSYLTRNNYYWLPIAPLTLPRSDLDANTEGYVVTAIGDFSAASGLPYFFGGTGSFADGFLFNGNGLNIDSPPLPDPANLYSLFPAPLQQGVDINGNPIYGYFSANVSYVVPGPLPLMGAGVAFGWSRRLRRRLKP